MREREITTLLTREQILTDYRLAVRSREMSIGARREVLSGRAKFGGFGGGKELPLLAMARTFLPGDFRSGYYRDQTLLLALGELSIQSFFAQLYAHADVSVETNSGGRQMPSHFATPLLDTHGQWLDLTNRFNSAADVSPTASQMPRLVGLAHASCLYRHLPELQEQTKFSKNGREVAFGIIGNASCAEGMFWESLNAIGVLKAPAVVTIMDDAYGISVPNDIQFAKENLSELLAGFARSESGGFNLYTVPGWDYAALVECYTEVVNQAREHHIPAIIHVTELTQPQGHSTSGSHERYKSPQRLQWEHEYDCLRQMRRWMLDEEFAIEMQLAHIEAEETAHVRQQIQATWSLVQETMGRETAVLAGHLERLAAVSQAGSKIQEMTHTINQAPVKRRQALFNSAFHALRLTAADPSPARDALVRWWQQERPRMQQLYSSHLHSESASSPLHIEGIRPDYSATPTEVPGFELLNRYFKQLFQRQPEVVTFGEDVGQLGGVNQTMAGLQEIYGELRISDTGIRECTIVGQAIGLAMRGLRPIAEIQYLDYLLYALQIMSDDLATLQWRTAGQQKAPVIVRTRGHRLEGVWHSGSLLGGPLHLLRGMHIVVPRDMTRAVGFYNTLLAGDDPALVIEPLLGYRRKEQIPQNLHQMKNPLGIPEVLRDGQDITIVTYGVMCDFALEAAEWLDENGISVEVIDVQTLLPFDIHLTIVRSLQKTNRVLFADEDVPGGVTAFMMQQVLEEHRGFQWLDSEPRTLTAAAHRPAYGTDGGTFSKPDATDIYHIAYDIMNESDPGRFPSLF